MPGMTRDQVSTQCSIRGRAFSLIDTGGIFDFEEDPFSTKVKEKAWSASVESEIVLYVLDGKRGMLPGEEELYIDLKKLNKPVLVIVNKVDFPKEEERIGEFFALGTSDLIPLSAEHKRNLGELEDRIWDLLPESTVLPDKEHFPRIALVGRINVGKSSLVNRLCGKEKLIVSEVPGTTRDSTDTIITRNMKKYCLVDTAGIRKLSRTQDKREKAGIIKAKKDIKQADVICLIMDAEEFPTRQDTAIAHIAHESGKPLVIVLNKWDLISKESETFKQFRKRLKVKMEFVSYAPVVFVSALEGKRVIKILDFADEVYENALKKISTSKLNKFLQWINETNPPISRRKNRIKIKYLTQKGSLPPSFLLFTHSKSPLLPSYEKFFIQKLRERFGLYGTPIRLILKRN